MVLAKPVIAAVNGYAMGGGCGLALSCDLALAGESARFGYPEVKHGIVAAIVMAGLVEHVGRKAAFDLVATGRTLDAHEARQLGMVNRVVADADLLARHRSVLGLVGLPTSYGGASFAELLTGMRLDKKTRGSQLRFVVLDALASPRILAGPDEALLEALKLRLKSAV